MCVWQRQKSPKILRSHLVVYLFFIRDVRNLHIKLVEACISETSLMTRLTLQAAELNGNNVSFAYIIENTWVVFCFALAVKQYSCFFSSWGRWQADSLQKDQPWEKAKGVCIIPLIWVLVGGLKECWGDTTKNIQWQKRVAKKIKQRRE